MGYSVPAFRKLTWRIYTVFAYQMEWHDTTGVCKGDIQFLVSLSAGLTLWGQMSNTIYTVKPKNRRLTTDITKNMHLMPHSGWVPTDIQLTYGCNCSRRRQVCWCTIPPKCSVSGHLNYDNLLLSGYQTFKANTLSRSLTLTQRSEKHIL
jgi:hypothetical protein